MNDALILVVDDDDVNRFTLSRRLVREGFHRIQEATNGREALDMLGKERFDLVLLDVMMPQMNGYQVLEAMQSEPDMRDIPVIIVSSLSEEESAIKCIELGAVDYLFKPVNPVLLRARMRSCLDRRRLQIELFSALTEFRTMLEISPLAIALVKSSKFVWVNPATSKLTGYLMPELEGMSLSHLFCNMADYNRMVEKFRRALATGESFHTEISIQRRDSRRVWIAVSTKALKPDNLSEGLIVIAEDVTEKRTDRERINFLAYHDMLTGLPNRMLMADRLQQALATAARNKRRVAVFFIDLDHFKEVNDTLGHEVGDQLIKQVGEKIKNCVRESDTVARFGGDEFLITLPDIMLLSDVEVVAKKVLAELNEPFRLAESTISTSSSIGISLYPDHGENIETLMKHADIAMYRAKQKGGNTYCFYHNGDEQAVSEGVLRDAY